MKRSLAGCHFIWQPSDSLIERPVYERDGNFSSLLFTRKLNVNYLTGQVFWLNHFKRLPIRRGEQWPCSKLIRQSTGNGFYSYGDSAGIEPDFPFNPLILRNLIGAKIGISGDIASMLLEDRSSIIRYRPSAINRQAT